MSMLVFIRPPAYVKKPTMPPDVRNAAATPAIRSGLRKLPLKIRRCDRDWVCLVSRGKRKTVNASINIAAAEKDPNTQRQPKRDAVNAPAGTPTTIAAE